MTTFNLLIVFGLFSLAYICGGSLKEDFCANVSFSDFIKNNEWIKNTSSNANCCETVMKLNCVTKTERVCADATEIKCNTVGWAECATNIWAAQGKKCNVIYKDFSYIDCWEEKYSVKHKKQVPKCTTKTVENCVNGWAIDEHGNKVWAGKEKCEPVSWEECVMVDEDVDFPSVKTNCKPVGTIKWTDFVQGTIDFVERNQTCEVKSSVNCVPVVVNNCVEVRFTECELKGHDSCDSQITERSKVDVDNSQTDLSEESKVESDHSMSDLTEDSILEAERSKVDVDNSLTDLSEESKVESDHSLSDLTEDSILEAEARWFFYGTCSCVEHKIPGQHVANCRVDIERPHPEKYSYLGYNDCVEGYVPVCGRIFSVCYCLCKWPTAGVKHVAVDGGWSNWSKYGQCSKNCGGGRQTRTRTCTNPVPQHKGRTCVGYPTETKDCNLHYCGNVEECIWENSRRPNCADVPKSKDGKREFRTIDGCCNNIDNPLFGKSETPLRRLIDAEYTTNPKTKTMDNPREASRGGELPSARLVSNTIFNAGVKTDRDFTHLLMNIGQFLDHDLVHVPTIPGGDCCHGAEGFDFPTSIEEPDRCFPIRVPDDDPKWGIGGSNGTRRTCMELKRSKPTLDCKAGVREHASSITHWIDMSMIYGNSETWLRNPKEKHLLLITNPTENNRRSLLPRCLTAVPEELKLKDNKKRGKIETCETCWEAGNKDCFFSGDVRTNENPALATMHTIWLREHNRIATALLSLNYLNHLTKDDIFEEARRIVIAEWQQIVYKEWLPIVIGHNFMNKFEMHPRKSGYSTRYNPSIDPRISNEFAAAAFRFGHNLVFDKIPQRDSLNQEQPPVDLKTVFDNPSGLNEPNFVDKTVRGMVGDAMPAMDAEFAEDILHNLFEQMLDLPALNIQRARDHGIPGYNKYRGECESVASGFGAVSSIDELTKDGRISQDDVNKLKQIYDHVDDIDLFVGGTLEFFGPHDDALLGPTFLCIIGDQFRRLKDGDRFFFENGGDSSTRFTLPQLNEIRSKVSMARILCDNTGIGSIQRQPFLQENPYTNPRYDCSDDEGHIPRLDLTVFVN